MEIFRIPILTLVYLNMDTILDTAWLDGGHECDPLIVVDHPIPPGI